MKKPPRDCLALSICFVATFGIALQGVHAQAPSPIPVLKNLTTTIGTVYCVDQDFLPSLEDNITHIRATVRAERAQGKFIGYISVPLSPAGGGSVDINQKVSTSVKRYLESQYGKKLWMLSPGAKEVAIPKVGSKDASGREYMYMWTQVLAGEDGLGRDFDFFYFVGPSDFWRALKLTKKTSFTALEALANKAGLTGDAKRLFVSYYAFRASATASRGSHDEWNILRRLNDARRSDKAFGVGDQVASYFDGRGIAIDDAESSVSTGYEGACQ